MRAKYEIFNIDNGKGLKEWVEACGLTLVSTKTFNKGHEREVIVDGPQIALDKYSSELDYGPSQTWP